MPRTQQLYRYLYDDFSNRDMNTDWSVLVGFLKFFSLRNYYSMHRPAIFGYQIREEFSINIDQSILIDEINSVMA